jgi:TolB-like protein
VIYRFDDFEIDTDRFELRRAGAVQKAEPQVFALLELLVSNADRLVTKDELNLRIWGGRVVSEAVVNSRIRSARAALGDDGKAQRLIQTVHKRGFRFVGSPVREDTAIKAVAADRAPGAAGAAAMPGVPSIAVLPFQLISTNPRYELLADAVAHEVIVELSRLHWLFVIARGSSFRFRGADVDLGAASAVLGVRYFLTGSVAIDGRRSVVTAELSQAADQRVLWADRFEGAVDDLLALRLTIAARIVTALEVRIPMAEASRAAGVPTSNLDSWSAYHRGLWHMYRFNAHDNAIAEHMFGRAIAADPGFARAHAGLSFTHFQKAFVGYSKDTEGERRLARDHADKSMALDPLDPFANLTLGRAHLLVGDVEGALSWFDRSVELNPNYAFAIYNRALADALAGAGGSSEQGAMRAMALSPIDPLRYAMLTTRALSHIARDDYAAASVWAQKAVEAPNAHVQIRAVAAIAHELAGNRTAAERWAAALRQNDRGFTRETFFKALPFRDERTRAAMHAALDRLKL